MDMLLEFSIMSMPPGACCLLANIFALEFYEMIHYFIMLMVALGMASATIVMKFLDDIVYGAVRMKESWKVAHELLMLYFREIDIRARRRSDGQGHIEPHGEVPGLGRDGLRRHVRELRTSRRLRSSSFWACGGTRSRARGLSRSVS